MTLTCCTHPYFMYISIMFLNKSIIYLTKINNRFAKIRNLMIRENKN